jgi:hypothetical protein
VVVVVGIVGIEAVVVELQEQVRSVVAMEDIDLLAIEDACQWRVVVGVVDVVTVVI